MNEIIRNQMQKFISMNGVKLVHIAKCINVDSSYLCHFLKGRRDMSFDNLQKLKAYMERGII
jgi:hypothetical protein